MILGHGDIANVLPDREDLLFFASGVSNSQETDEKAYERERGLLWQQDKKAHIVYFSSLAIFYGNSQYIEHKKNMETLLKKWFTSYTIIRIGNISWGKNPHTLINFIRNKINNKETFEIQDVFRFIVSKEEFLFWIKLIPTYNCEINIPGRMMKVIDIAKEYGYTK